MNLPRRFGSRVNLSGGSRSRGFAPRCPAHSPSGSPCGRSSGCSSPPTPTMARVKRVGACVRDDAEVRTPSFEMRARVGASSRGLSGPCQRAHHVRRNDLAPMVGAHPDATSAPGPHELGRRHIAAALRCRADFVGCRPDSSDNVKRATAAVTRNGCRRGGFFEGCRRRGDDVRTSRSGEVRKVGKRGEPHGRSGMQKAREPCVEQAVEVAPNHEDGTGRRRMAPATPKDATLR